MRLPIVSTIAVAATLSLLTSAAATHKACISKPQAKTIARTFGTLVSAYNNDTATALLAPTFTDYSSSINSLKNGGCSGPIPLLNITFTSRLDYQMQSSQQPPVPFEVQNVWHGCEVVVVRWLSAQTPQPVVGISVLEVKTEKGARFGFVVERIWAEFNSVAWLADVGVVEPGCAAQVVG